MRRAIVACVVWAMAVGTAAAQQRPLLTEDPETIGAGLILLEGGFDVQRDVLFPVSGLQGNLLRLPTIGVSVGVSPIAEIQIDGGLYNRLNITARHTAPLSDILNFTGNTTTDVEDILIGTKVRLMSERERRPALGLRFTTRLPNASNGSGLGTDTTDFYVALLAGKTMQSIRIVGNFGLGILTDPTRGNRQNDVFTYGLSLARAVREGVELVGEVNLRAHTREDIPTPGTESRAAMRFGGRITKGTVRADAGLIIGMTSYDPSVGFTAGLTWVFRGFTIANP